MRCVTMPVLTAKPSAYVLCKADKSLADAVKSLIRDNYGQIKALPNKIDCGCICDGGSDYYKFLGKRIGGYMPGHADEGPERMKWYVKVAEIFKEHGTRIKEGEEGEENVGIGDKNTGIGGKNAGIGTKKPMIDIKNPTIETKNPTIE